MVWPCAYLYASPGPVMRLPNIHASTDQLVWICVSPKYASRSGFGCVRVPDVVAVPLVPVVLPVPDVALVCRDCCSGFEQETAASTPLTNTIGMMPALIFIQCLPVPTRRRSASSRPRHLIRCSSKQNLDQPGQQILEREHRQCQRQERRRRRRDEPQHVVSSEGYEAHVARHRIAVADISERLDVARPEQGGRVPLFAPDPFLMERGHVSVGEQPIIGLAFLSGAIELRRKHDERAEDEQCQRADQPGRVHLE